MDFAPAFSIFGTPQPQQVAAAPPDVGHKKGKRKTPALTGTLFMKEGRKRKGILGMDKISLVNVALGRIGVAAVDSLEEKSQAARTVNQFYDNVLLGLLRRFAWSFAARMQELALVDNVYGKYKFAYRVPTDCVMVRRLYDGKFIYYPRDNKFKIIGDKDGKVLLTDIDKAVIEYTAEVTDTEVFDDAFVEVFTWKLAGEMALSLTGNEQLMQTCLSAYNSYMREAEGLDAQEENIARRKMDRLARARFFGAEEFLDER